MHAAGPAQALWKASATGDLLPASREVLSGRQKVRPALPPCTLSSVTRQLRAERRHCSTVGLRRFRCLGRFVVTVTTSRPRPGERAP